MSIQHSPIEKMIERARKDVRRSSEARAKHGPNSSRAAITSANARYARNAEYLERLLAEQERGIGSAS